MNKKKQRTKNNELLKTIQIHNESNQKLLQKLKEQNITIEELTKKTKENLDSDQEYYSSEVDTINTIQQVIIKEHPKSPLTPKEIAENFVKNMTQFTDEAKDRICITVNPDKHKTGGRRKSRSNIPLI